ncbi:acyltransferase [Ponticaulis sp.]|uniref:acyltransferase family protein n=1 Tax=Ponticaulis sp. TaxID=2020902 RepID=UPI0026142CF5|nr:acyltransferase [Ponticaulis sp.]MDF1682021.1 acyltransferase [Ponticaulis sp.]
MQSSFRFLLAWLVVLAHLTEGARYTSHTGIFAVFGFYLLSGYLITLILNTTYEFRFAPFAINRFLRLFPVYYIIAAATLIMIFLLPEAETWKPVWRIRDTLGAWLGNLFIFPFEFLDQRFRLVPPAWSVGVELINYFLLWLLISRSALFTALGLAAGVGYHVWTFLTNPEWLARYDPFVAAILPFALGAALFHARGYVERLSPVQAVLAAGAGGVFWVGNMIAAGIVDGRFADNFDLYFYLNLLFMIVIMVGFSHSSLNTRATGISKMLGDLAYPIFLLHWQVGFLVSQFVFDGKARGFDILAVSIPFILILAFGVNWLAARFIEPIRGKIRPGRAVSENVG